MEEVSEGTRQVERQLDMDRVRQTGGKRGTETYIVSEHMLIRERKRERAVI